MSEEAFISLPEDKCKQLPRELKDRLLRVVKKGVGRCAYYLGELYAFGSLGFPEDREEIEAYWLPAEDDARDDDGRWDAYA